jgi:hypothetical protein
MFRWTAVRSFAAFFITDLHIGSTPAFARGGHCGDGCQFFGTSIVTVALLVGVVYWGSMAWSYESIKPQHQHGSRRSYLTFAFVWAAILTALLVTDTRNILALLFGIVCALLLARALMKGR